MRPSNTQRWRVLLQMFLTYKQWYSLLFYPISLLLLIDKVL